MKRRRKLSARVVAQIRRDLALGVKQTYLAIAHGVSQATISNVNLKRGVYANENDAGEDIGNPDGQPGPIPTAMGGADNAGSAAQSTVDLDGLGLWPRCPVARAPGFCGLDTRRHAIRTNG
jgi:hypothetical protein